MSCARRLYKGAEESLRRLEVRHMPPPVLPSPEYRYIRDNEGIRFMWRPVEGGLFMAIRDVYYHWSDMEDYELEEGQSALADTLQWWVCGNDNGRRRLSQTLSRIGKL